MLKFKKRLKVSEKAKRSRTLSSFQKMDLNQDGVIAIDEFLDCCVRDEALVRSMGVFDSSF